MSKILVAAFILIFSLLFLQTACRYDNEIDQYGETPCDTSNVSYSQVIRPMVDENCVSCHGPGGENENVPFTTYDGLKQYAQEAVPRISGATILMPPTGAMSDCNVALFTAWVNAGAPNN